MNKVADSYTFWRRQSKGLFEDTIHALRVGLLLCPLAILMLALYYGGPILETKYSPVVVHFKITSMRPVDGGTIISAEADKIRDCSWTNTLWYYGTRSGLNVPLPEMRHLDAPEVKGVGHLKWKEIFIPLPPDKVKDTFSDAYHVCWPWNYLTKSEMYNPSEETGTD